jgi:hypothetical protein
MYMGGFHKPQAGSVRYIVCKSLVPVFKIGCMRMRFLLDSTIKSSRQPSIITNRLAVHLTKDGHDMCSDDSFYFDDLRDCRQ